MQSSQNKIYDLAEAREKIRRFCAYQERSQKQVEEKLKSYGLLDLAADELLLELIQENYLNEERFASTFARGKFSIKGWGVRKIEQALWQHRVSKPNIESALAEINQDQYKSKLISIAQKKYNLISSTAKGKREQKLIRFLLGKGYLYDEIKEALTHLEI